MAGLMDRLKEAALKAGRAAQKDPRLHKAAHNIKRTVESFQEGYRQQMGPERHPDLCFRCGKPLPPEARFCPHCGTRVD